MSLGRSCRHTTSVTAGTIFHRSRLSLTDWFAAVWFVTSRKNGVSALGLERVLGMGSYRTAYAPLAETFGHQSIAITRTGQPAHVAFPACTGSPRCSSAG